MKQVRIWMVQNDLSYRKLAAPLGVSAAYLHEILSGKKPMPIELGRRLTEDFGLPSDLVPEKERIAA